MPRRRTLREKIEARIARKKDDSVFLTREFTGLGGEDQVLRALRGLVRDGKLVRLGYGVYGRAIVSRLSGEAFPYTAARHNGLLFGHGRVSRLISRAMGLHAGIIKMVVMPGSFYVMPALGPRICLGGFAHG